MPIPVQCRACEAKLNAPDAAAGRKVKCPKCGAALEIPRPQESDDFEVIEEAQTKLLPPIKRTPSVPPAAAAKPKPAAREADEDDDDRPPPRKKARPVAEADEDYDDEPRPMKKRAGKAKKAGGMNMPLVLGVATVATAVVCGLVWYFVIREPEYTMITPPPPPQDSKVKASKGGPTADPQGKGGGEPKGQPVAWERPTPKPAPKGWKNYTGDEFDAWLPEDAPKPVIVDQPDGRGKRYTWTYGVVKIGAITGPFTPADIADYAADPLANLARGAEKIKLQLEGQGLKCEIKPRTMHGLPCQEVRTTPNGNLTIVMLVMSSRNKAILWSITAPGEDEQKTQKELLEPLLTNFIPK